MSDRSRKTRGRGRPRGSRGGGRGGGSSRVEPANESKQEQNNNYEKSKETEPSAQNEDLDWGDLMAEEEVFSFDLMFDIIEFLDKRRARC